MRCATRLRGVWAFAFVATLAGWAGSGEFVLSARAVAQDAPAPRDVAPKDGAAKSSAAAIKLYRDAVALQNRGVYDLAADEWARFLEKFRADPLAPKARHYLGVCHLQLKKYDEAVAAFAEVIKEAPELDLLDATYLNLGLAQYSQAQAGKREAFAAAGESLTRLIEKFPKSANLGQAWYYLGEIRYAQGQKAEAAKAYAAALEKETAADSTLRPEIVYALGVTQEELGDHAAAGGTYDLYLKEFPSHKARGEVVVRRGETLFATGKYDGAEQWFASAAAAKDFPLADHATMRQGASLFAQKKYPEAAALYAGLPAKFPKSPQIPAATLAAGNCLYLAGNFGEAEKWLGKAVEAGGTVGPEAAHWLARALLKQNKPADALTVVTKILPAAGDSPFAVQLLMDQADASFELDDRRAHAIELYAAVAKNHPDHPSAPQALYMSAFAALGQGKYQEAASGAAAFRQRYGTDALAVDVDHVGAEAALQLGDYAAAEATFARLAAEHADRPQLEDWQVRRALCLLLAKKYDAAIAAAEPLVSKLKKPDAVAEARYVIGSSLLAQQQYDAAAKQLAASVAAQPQWRQADEALLNLAAAQRQLNQPAEAVATIDKLLADYPQTKLADRAHFRRAECGYAAGDNAAAEKEYRLVLEKWPQGDLVPNALYGLAWSLLGQNKYDAAIAAVGSLVERFPQHALVPKARFARAMARQQTKDFEKAIGDLAAFLVAQPPANEKSDAYYVHGLCLVGLEKQADAIKQFETLLAKDAGYAGADKVLYELGWAHKSLDHETESTGAFARLAKEHADSPLVAEASFHVGEAHYGAKQYDAASEAYAAAMSKAGKSDLGEKAAHKLAWTHYQRGDFARAQEEFGRQTQAFPGGSLAADGLFMAAESLFKQGQFGPAQAAFKASLAKPPANPDYHALALLHAGQSASQQKQWADALALCERGVKEFPESAYRDELLFEQAWCEQNLGQVDAAYQHFDEVAGQSEREVGARARFMVGEILFDKKDFSGAVKQFFKVAYGFGYPESPPPLHKWQANSAYEAGRCFEALSRLDQAKKSYREVVDRYPDSDKAALAKENLARLGG